MLTPAEYNALPLPRKRELAFAVDTLGRMCAEAVALTRRAQFAGERAEAERYEIAAMSKRNEIFARQMEFALQGLALQIATDDCGNPIRVRKPLGFKSLDVLAAAQAETDNTPLPAMTKPRRRTK